MQVDAEKWVGLWLVVRLRVVGWGVLRFGGSQR